MSEKVGIEKQSDPYEKMIFILGIKGSLYNELGEVKNLLGNNAKSELKRLVDFGFTDEDIAKTLTSEKNEVHAYAVNILRKVYKVFSFNKYNYERRRGNDDNDRILIKAEKERLTADLDGKELIIFLTRYFGSQPMKKSVLAKDLKVSVNQLKKMELNMAEGFKSKLK